MTTQTQEKKKWKIGLPPGQLTQDLLDTFEVYFSPGGLTWHRRRTPEEIQLHKTRRERLS